MLTMIAAISKDRGLGYRNGLLFRLRQDMDFFKYVTMGKPVVMGLNTFKSIGKPLEGRTNYVVTHHPEDLSNKVFPITDFKKFLEEKQRSSGEFVIIGGARIYEEALPYVSTIYLTEINSIAEADAFFPELDDSFKVTTLKTGVEGNISFKINRYTRGDSSTG